MTKRGTWRLPFLPNWHIVSKAHQPTLSHRAAGVLLLDEKGLAQLIATDKGFHRPIAAEEILDFPVLINLLRRAQNRGRNHLQGIRVHNTVTLEPFRLLVVKHRENHAAGPQ